MEKGQKASPLISVITPSYNQAGFISETIESVLGQTYNNIEYIIIDGGSTDNTMEVIRQYGNRINKVVHEKDNGQTDAINKGFRMASGDWVGWINSDDTFITDAIEKVVNKIREKDEEEISVVMPSAVNWIDKHSKFIRKVSIPSRNMKDFLERNYSIIQPGSFYKTKNVRDCGELNKTLKYSMDLDYILRLLQVGKIEFLDEAISNFRIWELSKTSTGTGPFLKEIRNTLRQNGMRVLSPNNIRISYEMLKHQIKSI